METKIMLFIPAYNCEKQIVRVLRQLDDSVLKYISEVIVINNCSTDDTEEAVANYMKTVSGLNIKLIRNHENYGLGGSHKIAFHYAINNNFTHIIVLHGDDQGDIHDVLPLLEDESYKKFDSCLGSRFAKGSKLINYSKFRIFGNRVFNMLISVAACRRLTDLGSGLNLYYVNYLKTGFFMNFPDNLTFNVYMLLYGVYSKSRFMFFPLTWKEEDQISNAKFIKQSKEILSLIFKYVYKKNTLFRKGKKTSKRYGYKVIRSACTKEKMYCDER